MPNPEEKKGKRHKIEKRKYIGEKINQKGRIKKGEKGQKKNYKENRKERKIGRKEERRRLV